MAKQGFKVMDSDMHIHSAPRKRRPQIMHSLPDRFVFLSHGIP